jgi:uncharacterized membrane protein YtjA (UPF0391 family)
MDRRALFFLVAAIACALLMTVITPSLRWVPRSLAVIYLVLALVSYVDARVNR